MKQYLTPDGQYYAHAGEGYHIPRPYSLRLLPRVMPPTGVAWNVLMWSSLAVATVCVYIMAVAKGVNPFVCVLSLLALPYMRNALYCPVLLDVPMIAMASLTAVLAIYSPSWVVACAVVLSVFISERTPLWSALYSAMFTSDYLTLGIAVVIAGLFSLWLYIRATPHIDELNISWLRHPLKSAIEKHRPTIHSYQAWLGPWGLAVIGICAIDVLLWVSMALAYLQCLVAMDRTRVYSIVCVPLILSAVYVAGDYSFLVPLSLWFSEMYE